MFRRSFGGIFPLTSVGSSQRAGLKKKKKVKLYGIQIRDYDICQMVQMEIVNERLMDKKWNYSSSNNENESILNFEIEWSSALSWTTIFHWNIHLFRVFFFIFRSSEVYIINVPSALKVNASIKLKLTTLNEDIIKWLSFVTITVIQQLGPVYVEGG